MEKKTHRMHPISQYARVPKKAIIEARIKQTIVIPTLPTSPRMIAGTEKIPEPTEDPTQIMVPVKNPIVLGSLPLLESLHRSKD
jgi:hypothetical protein